MSGPMVVVPRVFCLLNLRPCGGGSEPALPGSKTRAHTSMNYRFAVPRASFFTLRLAEPRAYSRGFSGLSVLRFFRDARFVFLRSSLVSLLVFAMSAVWFSLGNR